MQKTLFLKAIRDLKSHWGAYLACAMLMAIGVMFYSSMTQVVSNVPVAMDQFYEEYGFGDAFATVNNMPASRVDRLTSIDGIEKASGRLSITVNIADSMDGSNRKLLLYSYDPLEIDRLNDILVTEGAAPREGQYEIALSEGFYKANKLLPGDAFSIVIYGKKVSFSVCASVQTPEYIYVMPEGGLFPDDYHYGIAYVPLDVLETLLGRAGEVNDISLNFQSGVVFDDLERDIRNMLAPYGVYTLHDREDQSSHGILKMEIDSMQSMVGVIPVIFLLLGALVMSVIIKRMVEQQHAQIGLLKAFGYPTGKILAHYMIYGVVIGLMASLIGGVLGAFVSEYIAVLYTAYFIMPGITGAFSIENVLMLSVLALCFGVGASIYGARSVLRLKAAEAMRPPAPPAGKPILLERRKRLWRRISSATQMSLRNLFRAKSRSMTTFLGLTICYAITAAVFSFSPMIDYMMVENFTDVQRYDYRLLTVNTVHAQTLEKDIAHLKNVDLVEAVLDLPVTVRCRDKSKDTAVIGIPFASKLYCLYDDDRKQVLLPTTGAMITYRMAEALGVDVGDDILLDFPYPDKEITVKVAGLSEQYTSNSILISRAYLCSMLREPDFANGAMFTIYNTGDEPESELTQTLNEGKNIASIMNTSQVQKSTGETIEMAMSTLYAMAVMAIFASFAIVYNAGVVILSERTRELASMRVMGFTLFETVRVVAVEQAVLVVFSTIAGIPLTGMVMQSLTVMINSDAFTIPSDVPVTSYFITFLSMAAAWLLAMAVALRKVKRTNMADVLKERD
ncbi:ABC transporter permease [Christensenellaceae bacterium OttesenSCG-928-M15]|nr:ABC transporter permease [Christensenellaceae bacterium OttesenSCG-928-M15]